MGVPDHAAVVGCHHRLLRPDEIRGGLVSLPRRVASRARARPGKPEFNQMVND